MLSWDEFGSALAAELAGLPVGALMVIEERGEFGRYVQFVHMDDNLYAELMSDRNPAVTQAQTPEQCQLIAGLGWREPGTSPESDSNWWTALKCPIRTADYRRLATMVVSGLRDGLGMSSPGDLTYRAWNSLEGNLPLEVSGLDIARAPEPPLARGAAWPPSADYSPLTSLCSVGPSALRGEDASDESADNSASSALAPEGIWEPPPLPGDSSSVGGSLTDCRGSSDYLRSPPFNPPAPPADLSEMTSSELVEFVRWIRNLAWGWNIYDIGSVITAAGLIDLVDLNPDGIAFTSNYSTGRFYLDFCGERVAYFDAPVANLPDFEHDGTRLRNAMARMTDALTAEYGKPMELPAPVGLERYGPYMEWVGAENTVTLSRDALSVRAVFRLNEGATVVCGEDEHARRVALFGRPLTGDDLRLRWTDSGSS
ncbi:hypothetical protein B7C42_03578 [Nocardia cerradoensis]|uniref:TY-Chap N-terminal domain-containing protein n=1 Tax=Nocardia cerradoensis TaxID=85688 RepID=A0A231H5H3_9NOCA|nr:hypothetical protein B7C42_03578 [Nocardia cerradoensis]